MTTKDQKRIIDNIAKDLPKPSNNTLVKGSSVIRQLTKLSEHLNKAGKLEAAAKIDSQIIDTDPHKYYKFGGDKLVERTNHARRMWSIFTKHNGRFVPTEGGYLLVCPEVWKYYEQHKPQKVNS